MTASLEIEETPEGLLIRSVRRGSVLYALLSGALCAAVVFLLGRMYFHRPALAVITVVAAIWGSARWWRTIRVELRITKLELQASAGWRVGYRFDLHIPLADIKRLVYRSNRGEADRPGGLYVVHRWKADCVLPRLDEIQAQRAIDAIHRRFPMIPILPAQKEHDVPDRTVITLDLGSSKDQAPGRAPNR